MLLLDAYGPGTSSLFVIAGTGAAAALFPDIQSGWVTASRFTIIGARATLLILPITPDATSF